MAQFGLCGLPVWGSFVFGCKFELELVGQPSIRPNPPVNSNANGGWRTKGRWSTASQRVTFSNTMNLDRVMGLLQSRVDQLMDTPNNKDLK